jgi:hypothetical protein
MVGPSNRPQRAGGARAMTGEGVAADRGSEPFSLIGQEKISKS